MIKFQCSTYDNERIPIISNDKIMEYAEALVGDYKPELLKEPGKINGIYFVESYLGATVDYQDIYYDEGTSPIAGATVFNDDVIKVFDREKLKTRNIFVPANTILIDNDTISRHSEGFANFTALHEGGHLCMHGSVYRKYSEQLSANSTAEKTVCCRTVSIERHSHARRKMLSPREKVEHQANVFAAYAAMPRHTFIPFVREQIMNTGFKKGVYILDESGGWEYWYYLDKITKSIAETYGVSTSAAEIHMKDTGLLITKYQYEDMKKRIRK